MLFLHLYSTEHILTPSLPSKTLSFSIFTLPNILLLLLSLPNILLLHLSPPKQTLSPSLLSLTYSYSVSPLPNILFLHLYSNKHTLTPSLLSQTLSFSIFTLPNILLLLLSPPKHTLSPYLPFQTFPPFFPLPNILFLHLFILPSSVLPFQSIPLPPPNQNCLFLPPLPPHCKLSSFHHVFDKIQIYQSINHANIHG